MTDFPRLFVAVDTSSIDIAKTAIDSLSGAGDVGVKLGKEFFVANGPSGVKEVIGDMPLFLDLKFHDIPNTVAGAVRSALALKPVAMTIHASGGLAMMKAAVEVAQGAPKYERPFMLAVTVLTSLDDNDLPEIGFNRSVEEQVMKLAALAKEAGMDGVICSGNEVAMLRQALGPDFKLVVPGVRPPGANAADQKRVFTPLELAKLGVDAMVAGRPIMNSPDPAAAARAFLAAAGDY